MFGFLKNLSQKHSKKSCYFDCLEIIPWSQYQQMTDKYQKLLSFTVEGIDDEEVLKELFRCDARVEKHTLPKHIKQKIKDTGMFLYQIRAGRYLHISYILEHYWQAQEQSKMKLLHMSEYHILSTNSNDNEEEMKLDKIIVHGETFLKSNLCPPNFFYDTTHFRPCFKKDIVTKYKHNKHIEEISFKPEADFNFNIPLYLYEQFGIKK